MLRGSLEFTGVTESASRVAKRTPNCADDAAYEARARLVHEHHQHHCGSAFLCFATQVIFGSLAPLFKLFQTLKNH